MSACSIELETTNGSKWLCGKTAKARNMCNAHLLQESMGKPMTIPRGWSTDVGVLIGGTQQEGGTVDKVTTSHATSVEEYIATVSWLTDNDPVIVALKSTARELDNHYSNATLNQYRLLLKDIRDSKPKDIEESAKARQNRMFLEFMER